MGGGGGVTDRTGRRPAGRRRLKNPGVAAIAGTLGPSRAVPFHAGQAGHRADPCRAGSLAAGPGPGPGPSPGPGPLAAGPAGGRAHLDTTFMILTRAPVPCAVRVGQSEPVSPSHLFRVSQCECVILSQSVQASQSESVISPSQSFRVSQSMSVVPSKSVQSSQSESVSPSRGGDYGDGPVSLCV
jgi:hypothetical protein